MRKNILFLVACLLAGARLYATDSTIHIIPEPVSVTKQHGFFLLGKNVPFRYDKKNGALDSTVGWFKSLLDRRLVSSNSNAKPIRIDLVQQPGGLKNREGYTLDVSPDGIKISAASAAGVFYAFQTLMQLMPAPEKGVKAASMQIPAVTVLDYPRFGWRGLMLDVSRHFFTKEEVERFIDEMSRYKFNVFHWHLSDDQGWRIEIKSLPELTQKGAWRVQRTGRWGTFEAPKAGEPMPYGGYYTQEDVREVIRYAASRHITVVPEIDVPGHSLAMIAAYPNLSSTGLQYQVNPGSPFYAKEDNVLSPAVDSVYLILDKVFTELSALFPSPYIHIGGDEVYKGFWGKDPKCQALMKKEGLKNTEELQSYFIKKMEKILQGKGKKLVGWDEILQGGLTPEATVMSWRGMDGGITAARMNHHVVMTPWDFTYLDLYQGDPLAEPATYGMCRLRTSYNYEPVPDGVEEQYILGGQGNLWTESVPNFRHAEYMTWPRGLALSEVYWSPRSKKNWTAFTQKLPYEFKRMDADGIKYARSAYDCVFVPSLVNDSTVTVELDTEIPGLDVYYSFDETNPDNHYQKYTGKALSFPAGADQLNAITYQNGQPAGQQINIKKDELVRRAKAKKHVY